jgi:hypothetical protein
MGTGTTLARELSRRPFVQGAGALVVAIAGAFFDATGVRLREMPMTPARVRAALRAAGR